MFLSIANKSYAQTGNLYPKDPQLAFTLALVNPAYGQFYIGKPYFGILYWTIDKVLFLSLMFSLFDVKITFPADVGIHIEFDLPNKWRTERIVAVSVLGALFLGFRVFSVWDSRRGALEYNKKLLQENLSMFQINQNIEIFCSIDDLNRINLSTVIYI